MLRLAIIGVGWAGSRQAEAVAELGRKIALAALVDNDPQHLATKAREFGVGKTYLDHREALADTEIDAVSICTPHPLHAPLAIAAAQAGKHILVEKPMAMDVAEATEMMSAAEAHGVTLYVAENAVYTPVARTLREIVASGRGIGELTYASFAGGFRAPEFGYPGRRAWLTTLEQGGTGTWMLHGIHSMAQLRYILGEVTTIYMREHKAPSFQRRDLEGTMSGLLTLESGVQVAVLQTCETRLRGDLAGYLFFGSEGVVRGTAEGYRLLGDGQQPSDLVPYPEGVPSSYALELEAFADAVAGVAMGPTDALSERRSLAVVQAGYESAQSGRPVILEERFGPL
ncbi:MAG: Gfo/Idh/MocA family oxidoreductase [Anaerolineae bacterium]|nr:Gfo/Idh/MocA family oxidoreductase [Anaerolineae bacterium]